MPPTTSAPPGNQGPSWRLQFFDAMARALIRRQDWGEGPALASRARRVLGMPSLWRWSQGRGAHFVSEEGAPVKGEWALPAKETAGTLLYLHGGGYVACSPLTHRPIAAGLARRGGFRVFSLDYRLAPEYPYPAALDDAVAAYQWLLSSGDLTLAGGATGSGLALAGDSAGGGLALALMQRIRTMQLPLPSAVVLFSPWTDMEGSGQSIQANSGRCSMFLPQNITGFAQCYLAGHDPSDPMVSPVHADLSGLPPTLIQVGSRELLLDDARRTHQRILQTGGVSHLTEVEHVFHCWQMMDGLVPEAGAALDQAAAFMLDPTDPKKWPATDANNWCATTTSA